MAELRGGLLLYKEPAIGDINDDNVVFTSQYPFIAATLRVLLNGLEQEIEEDYVIVDNQTIQFVNPPIGGDNADTIQLSYQRG